MKSITISLYNRPKYTATLLEHLNNCYGIEDYDITICCEPGNEQVQDLALNFRKDQTSVIINNRKYGCNTNIYQCLAIGFSKNDYHIHFEDDTIPGKDCLKYFEWANDEYKDDQSIFTISSYVNSDSPTEHFFPANQNTDLVSQRNWFTPWGWATWKDRFEEMKSVWDFTGKNGSWDATINDTARRNRNEIFPHVARCQNIGGELGTHVPSADWHKEHHLNTYWIESLNNYQTIFKGT